jgi:hypothetical protein
MKAVRLRPQQLRIVTEWKCCVCGQKNTPKGLPAKSQSAPNVASFKCSKCATPWSYKSFSGSLVEEIEEQITNQHHGSEDDKSDAELEWTCPLPLCGRPNPIIHKKCHFCGSKRINKQQATLGPWYSYKRSLKHADHVRHKNVERSEQRHLAIQRKVQHALCQRWHFEETARQKGQQDATNAERKRHREEERARKNQQKAQAAARQRKEQEEEAARLQQKKQEHLQKMQDQKVI